MRKFFLHILLLCFFFLILIFPGLTLNGAVSGLLLWYSVVLPTLLPFIIVTNLILHTNSFTFISNIFGGPFERFFSTSKAGTFAVMIGFLCGYPMGAKTIVNLYNNQSIPKNEAHYLLSFCNNASPMFIIGFLVTQTLGDTHLLLPTLICLYGAPVVVSFFTRRYYGIKKSNTNTVIHLPPKGFTMAKVDESIMDGITLIVKIGGYIMLFSIFISLLTPLTLDIFPSFIYPLSLLEVTNGIKILSSTSSFTLPYLQLIFITAFGGLCAIAQTQCVLQDSDLSIFPYFIQKIITAIIAVIIGYFTLCLL